VPIHDELIHHKRDFCVEQHVMEKVGHQIGNGCVDIAIEGRLGAIFDTSRSTDIRNQSI
jgi:hypothetical protein